jgi:hypothetical protein
MRDGTVPGVHPWSVLKSRLVSMETQRETDTRRYQDGYSDGWNDAQGDADALADAVLIEEAMERMEAKVVRLCASHEDLRLTLSEIKQQCERAVRDGDYQGAVQYIRSIV